MVEYFDSGDLGVVTLFSEKTHPLFDAAAVILKDISITGSLQTNIKFLEELVTHPWVRECIFHMHFIEEDFIPMTPPQLLRVKSSSDAREIVKQYLRALVSGRVYALLVRETGVSMISEHEILIWIESFGELVPHAISYSSRILHWRVEVGTRVTVGQELAEIEVYKGHRKR
jgi:pyruvate carboxylase